MAIHRLFSGIRVKKDSLRVQLSIVLVLALTILLIVYFHYSRSRDALLDECGSLIRESMTQIDTTIELTLENILDISKQSYNDPGIEPLLNSREQLRRYDSYSYLMRKLDQIKNSNRNIDSLAFYLENDGKFIYQHYGATNYFHVEDDIFLDWYGNKNTVDIAVADTHTVVLGNSKKDVFSVFARLPMGNGIRTKGALIINISPGFIYKEIIDEMETSPLFYIADKKGRIIFSQDEELLYTSLEDTEYLRNTGREDASHNIVLIDGSPNLVVTSTSNERDWQYIMAYPINQLYSTISNIRDMMIILSLVVLLCGSLLIFSLLSFAFRSYDEIFSLIKNKVASCKPAATGNIREDVLQLFTDHELIQEKLDTVYPLFKDKFRLSLVMQSYSREVITEQMDQFGIALPIQGLVLSIIEIDSGSSEMGVYSDYIESLSVSGIIESVMSGLENNYFYVDVMHKRIVLVTALGMEELLLRLDQIILQIRQHLHLTVVVGVCNTACGIAELNMAYQHALETIPYKIIFGKNRIILYSDISRSPQKIYRYPRDRDETLRILIKSGNQERALEILTEMFDEIKQYQSYFAVQQFVSCLNASIMETMEELSFTGSQLAVYRDMQSFDGLDTVWSYFHKLICSIIEQTKQRSDVRMDQYFRRIRSCIEENYNNNLSLEQVCTQVKLSPTYVNQILKKYTGHSFTHYLNAYRIELSCTLLADPHMKIMDISGQLGFNSAKYFIKLFKDSKGLTPGEYRKQFLAGPATQGEQKEDARDIGKRPINE